MVSQLNNFDIFQACGFSLLQSSPPTMGQLCATTTDLSPPPNRIIPAPSTGSSKYGPYTKNHDGTWVPASTHPDLPPSFEKESSIRTWLLDHITIKGKQKEQIVRSPGTLSGSQLILSDCTDCDIYIMDHTSTVSVDRCTNCRIFVGPCDSSVFLRECRDCKFVIATRQLRTRDCTNNDMLLFCGTEPVIEKTKKLRLGCFRGTYFGLEKHLETCALTPFHNCWKAVHDFTPGSGSGQNWEWLDAGMTGKDLGMKTFDGLDWEDVTVVPPTPPPPPSSSLTSTADLVLFAPTADGAKNGRDFIERAVRESTLIDCKHQVMFDVAYQGLPQSAASRKVSPMFRAACVVRPDVDGTDSSRQPKTLAVLVRGDAGLPALTKMLDVLPPSSSDQAEGLPEELITKDWYMHSNQSTLWFDHWSLAV